MKIPQTTILAALAGCLLTGCSYEATATPEGMLIHWSPQVRAAAWGLPVMGILVGVGMLNSVRLFSTGVGMIVLSVLGSGVSAVVLADEVVLTESEVYDTVGFAWNRKPRGFQLEGLERILISTERERTRRSSYDRKRWYFVYGSDDQDGELYPGSLWNAATDLILDHVIAKGVAVGPDVSDLYPHLSLSPELDALLQTQAFDAAEPADRLQALLHSGRWKELRQESGTATLRESFAQPEGVWTHTFTDRNQVTRLELRLDPANQLTYTVESGGRERSCTGYWRCSEEELELGVQGASFTVFPRPSPNEQKAGASAP